MRSQSVALLISLAFGGCGEPAGPPGPLEIGVRDEASGAFHLLAADDAVPVVLGANGLNMIVPSLRAREVDPHAPDPTVVVEVAGIVMAADIEGARADMQEDGDGYVLWDLRVPFQTELCCYNCATAVVRADIEDSSGRAFQGEVSVVLARGACPDDRVCCGTADACPDPSITQVCQ